MRAFLGATTVCLVGGVLLLSIAEAAPPRKWTDTTGKFSVEAELVEIKDGAVHLKKADGQVITVPIAKLSEADRLYLSNRSTAKSPPVAKPAETPPTETPAVVEDPSITGIMKHADADRDGKITRAEWSKFAQNFRNFDVNHNDALEGTELEAIGDVELLLQLADANNDKKIVRAEWAQLAQGFVRLDKDKNSMLAKAELQEAADEALARSSGTASLAGEPDKPKEDEGPTVWRGEIETRGAIEIVVKGNQIVARDGDNESLGMGTFTMSGDGKIGNMDALYTEGEHRGEVCLGIYRKEEDKLVWCVSNRDGQRPQGFVGGNGNWLLVLTKVPNP